MTPSRLPPTVRNQRLAWPRRIVAGERTLNLSDEAANRADIRGELLVIVDRLLSGEQTTQRLRDSLETAFRQGDGRLIGLVEVADTGEGTLTIDDRHWRRIDFSNRLECSYCRRQFADPEPRRLSFNSPLGACPTCEGFGNVAEFDVNRIVPDPSKSIREGAIAPWNTPSYRHELDELLAPFSGVTYRLGRPDELAEAERLANLGIDTRLHPLPAYDRPVPK